MEHLALTIKQIQIRIGSINFLLQTFFVAGMYWLIKYSLIPFWLTLLLMLGGILLCSFIIGWAAGRVAKVPLGIIGQAILHISPGHNGTKAPTFDSVKIGRQYITGLVNQLYQIASLQDNKILAEHRREATSASTILDRLPLPIFIFNKQQQVTFASEAGFMYCAKDSATVLGASLFEVMDLEFSSPSTLESWINDCQKDKVTDTQYWRRVRIKPKADSETLKQCDIAAYYNRDNPKGVEFIIAMFDRTEEYNQDDESLSFVALAVHELRTPLTVKYSFATY